MDLNEVKAFLSENKDNEEVQAFLNETVKDNLTIDVIKDFAKSNEDGKKWLQTETDRATTKGINTWREKNLQKEVDTKIKELYPDESEEAKALKQLRQELEQEKQARITEALRNKALSEATTKNLPTDLVDFFLGQDEETTVANLGKFEAVFQQAVQTAVQGTYQQQGYNPKPPAGSTVFTKEQLATMSPEEINANWSTIEKQMAAGQL